MTPTDFDPLELLAHAIRDTVSELGAHCTGHLLGAVALDLIESDEADLIPETRAVPA